jgi:hypothetical protein
VAPEVTAALIGGVAALICAVLGLVPVVVAFSRRQRGAVEAEGTATRDSLDALGARFDARIDDVRTDLREQREHITDVRAWQAGHDAEHYLQGRPQQRGDN